MLFVLLPILVGALLTSIITRKHKESERLANGAREFRVKVNEALAQFQRTEENWTANNRNFRAMANFAYTVDFAVKDFAEALTGKRKTRFINKWQETKNYCSTTLPKSLGRGVSDAANDAKTIFLNHVEDLLKFAK